MPPGAFPVSRRSINFEVPEIYNYDYMIYFLAKTLCLSLKDAGKHTELDFWRVIAYENIDYSRMKEKV